MWIGVNQQSRSILLHHRTFNRNIFGRLNIEGRHLNMGLL